MESKFAIEIKNLETYQFATTLFPDLDQLSPESVFGQFMVFDYQGSPVALFGPGAVLEFIDHIENSHTLMIKKVFFKK
jgi:hypothetical protein